MTGREWVVVAGAAGDIGQALCAMCQAQGYAVVAVDVRRQGRHVDEWIESDLAMATDRDVETLRSSLGTRQLRHVIVVTGGATVEELRLSPREVAPLAVIRKVVELNLITPFVILGASLNSMIATSGMCSFTVVSSINAFGGYGAPAYSAAKAGLAGFVAAYAESLGELDIRVNGVALGTTETRNLKRLNREAGRETDLSALGRIIPLGQVLSPRRAAETVWMMASQGEGVTGQVLVCDGGQHLRRARTSIEG
jgi:NAD(P)-dependent dehydrogenase (short-subunit alcohol dehydrogenase family)